MKSIVFILAVVISFSVLGQRFDPLTAVSGNYQEDQLYFKLKSGYSFGDYADKNSIDRLNNEFSFIADLLMSNQAKEIERTFKILGEKNESLGQIYSIHLTPGLDLDKLIAGISRNPRIEYCEKVPQYSLQFTPNDPDYTDPSKRWHLDTIHAEQAWDMTQGCSAVTIAIVDDAILTNHEDLAPNLFTNFGEVPNNGIDDDGNGYIDDYQGYDVADLNADPNPPANATNTYFTHGTHVAGIASGSTNNATGKASIGFNTKIVPVKTKSNFSPGNQLDAAIEGVEYAIALGVDVINMSWGGGGYSQTHLQLFEYAKDQGIVCVGAAGNYSIPGILLPAGYPSVISVGASDQNNDLASFTNYHVEMDVYAPGVGIWSCLAGGTDQYGFLDGTSMASPLVAGMIALKICMDPTFTVDNIRNCLKYTTNNYPTVGYPGIIGIADAKSFLECLPPNDLLCEASPCELVKNGGFETPRTDLITEYSGFLSLCNKEACSWQAYGSTTDVFPLDLSFDQQALCGAGFSGTGYEGVVTNKLHMTPGETYTLNFDYAVAQDLPFSGYIDGELDTIIYGLIYNSYDWVLGVYDMDTLILGGFGNIPVDFMRHTAGVDSLYNGLFDVPSHLHSFSTTFVAPADTTYQRLFIHINEYDVDVQMWTFFDNVSVQPVLNVTASSDNYNLSPGDCANLTAIGTGGHFEWTPQGYFTDPYNQNQTVCPDTALFCQTGSLDFQVTVMDSISGCSMSDSLTLNLNGIDTLTPIPTLNVLDTIYSQCGYVSNVVAPTAYDHCGGIIIGTPDVGFPITAQGFTQITWTYDDGNGQSITQTQEVLISNVDNTGPVPLIQNLQDIQANCNGVNLSPPTAMDNCDGMIVATTTTTFPITTIGQTTVVWTFTDLSGNATAQTQLVTITDTFNTSYSVSNSSIWIDNSNYNYQWYDCSTGFNLIPGETDYIFNPDSSGNYLCIISNGICLDTTDCIEFDLLEIDEENQQTLNLYPNPANEYVVINSTVLFSKVEIFDMSGRLIELIEFTATKEKEVDLSNYPPAVYSFKIHSVNRVITRRLIKH